MTKFHAVPQSPHARDVVKKRKKKIKRPHPPPEPMTDEYLDHWSENKITSDKLERFHEDVMIIFEFNEKALHLREGVMINGSISPADPKRVIAETLAGVKGVSRSKAGGLSECAFHLLDSDQSYDNFQSCLLRNLRWALHDDAFPDIALVQMYKMKLNGEVQKIPLRALIAEF